MTRLDDILCVVATEHDACKLQQSSSHSINAMAIVSVSGLGLNLFRRVCRSLDLKKLIITALVLGSSAMACGCAGSGHSRGLRSRWLEGGSEADRVKLHHLRELVKDDPTVRAANEKRKRANDKYHEAVRAAILKRDPTLAPILDQIRKQQNSY